MIRQMRVTNVNETKIRQEFMQTTVVFVRARVCSSSCAWARPRRCIWFDRSSFCTRCALGALSVLAFRLASAFVCFIYRNSVLRWRLCVRFSSLLVTCHKFSASDIVLKILKPRMHIICAQQQRRRQQHHIPERTTACHRASKNKPASDDKKIYIADMNVFWGFAGRYVCYGQIHNNFVYCFNNDNNSIGRSYAHFYFFVCELTPFGLILYTHYVYTTKQAWTVCATRSQHQPTTTTFLFLLTTRRWKIEIMVKILIWSSLLIVVVVVVLFVVCFWNISFYVLYFVVTKKDNIFSVVSSLCMQNVWMVECCLCALCNGYSIK